MFKTRYTVPGEAPGVLKVRKDASQQPPVITLIEFDAGFLEERVVSDSHELLSRLNNERVSWMNIDGLGDINILRILGERFNLHPLALEDVLDTGQRPKVDSDPTELNRRARIQGRSIAPRNLPADAVQADVAKAYIAQLDQAHAFKKAIVTRIEPDRTFYPAEGYHQDFLTRNPTDPYIAINDLPKIEDLKRFFPDLYPRGPGARRGSALVEIVAIVFLALDHESGQRTDART